MPCVCESETSTSANPRCCAHVATSPCRCTSGRPRAPFTISTSVHCMRSARPVPNAFNTASLAAKRAARCSYGRRAPEHAASSRAVNRVCRIPGFSAARRSTRSAPTRSTPTRICKSGDFRRRALRDHADQVLDGEQAHDLARLELASQLVGIELWHHLLEVGQSDRVDDARLIAKLLIWDATLDIGPKIRRLDLDPQFALEPEQDVEQIDGLGAQVTEQCGVGCHFVFFDAQRGNNGLCDCRLNLVMCRCHV